MTLLSDEELEEQILYLAGWRREGDSITKRFEFASFPRAIEFINEIAFRWRWPIIIWKSTSYTTG